MHQRNALARAVTPHVPVVAHFRHASTLRAARSLPVAFDSGDSSSVDEVKNVVSQLSPDEFKQLLQQLAANADLAPSETARVDVFERVSPSVAYIQTKLVQQTSPFSSRTNEYPMGAGSGFVWDADGHVVTNFHVVNGGPLGRPSIGGQLPRKVMVKLPGSEEQTEATIVGTEPDKDLAVLKVDPTKVKHLRPIEVGTSASLRVGQNVLAIGNPFGLDWTLTTGIVSALGRDIEGAGGRPIKDCVQTDAAINPGNSGGPLLDSQGRLIGVNTMIYAPNGIGANVGIGFAVPADTVKRVVNQIIQFGSNARPSLGVSVLPDGVRRQYSMSLDRKLEGAIIAEVVPGSPADALKLAPMQKQWGGILLGDMITAVNGKTIRVNEDLLCAVEESEPDAPIKLTVMRNCEPDRIEEIEITPVQRKSLMSR